MGRDARGEDLKYIMLELKIGQVVSHLPIIFPNLMVHSEVAKYIQQMLFDVHKFDTKVHSAGEVTIECISCHGGSSTLNKDADLTLDRETIDMFDYFHGIVKELDAKEPSSTTNI